ncbi:MAG: valine--tRNA ligase [Flavisolibacter sp.]|nr:valine--tRNA ligase [Flavisolibacter sp.]
MSNSLSKNFEPQQVEDKWYQHWLEKRYFNSKPDGRPPFTVVIPPPNVTGVLHMGHTLNETVQDVLVRKARMSGFNACWVPGSDHASIATEAKVVQMLKEKGVDKNELSREEFLKYAFEWKEKYGGIIYHQIKKLGCSVDWDRVNFTMDDHYYKAVIKVFIDLYKKGMIYRGARMINWDPAAKTALSDEEVEYRDIQGKLYYIKYFVVQEKSEVGSQKSDLLAQASDFVVIATQRPETIMGDTALAVNPNDERYQHLKGKKVIVPLVNREVPIIFDDYVDPAFGTGALKITPAHDINDYNLGLKHHLPAIDTLNEDGTLSEAAEVFVGLDRFEARKKAIEKLKEEGLLIKEEEYQTRLGFSQRTQAVVEPRISTQWFVKMRELADKALNAVTSGEVKIHPEERFLATYKYWLENIKDWCISRQLWWGQRIPAWYNEEGKFVVAETEEEAKKMFNAQYSMSNVQLKQDEDVLDTWFSSWLWPIEVFHGITQPHNPDINYYYPTSVLVTGQDIIFFWVARMIMAGEEYMNQKPFDHVYFTGMVRDKQGRKMSKSLGNSPDLLDLIDRFGADAVRFGIMISSPAGNDLLFDDSSCEQGRNFNNKIWNALKLVKMWEGRVQSSKSEVQSQNFAVDWFENRLNEVKAEVEEMYKQFRLSEALKTIYSLIWDDFCSWYLEWVKPGFEQPIDQSVYEKTIAFFTELMQLLHPFMPFVTEEIYHQLKDRADDLCVKQFAPAIKADASVLQQGELLKQTISAIRDARVKNNIKPKDVVSLYIQTSDEKNFTAIQSILSKQVNAPAIHFIKESKPNTITVVVGSVKFFVETENELDVSSQKEQLLKDLEYQKGFLASVEKKLSNERFVQNAKPEVVELERRKKADAEQKIKALEESLAALS